VRVLVWYTTSNSWTVVGEDEGPATVLCEQTVRPLTTNILAMNLKLKPRGTERLELKYYELLSTYAFKLGARP